MSFRAAILSGLFVSMAACTTNDLGKSCTPTTAPVIPTDPVQGEQPVVEVVSVERATECESFQCLTHGGYAPYCTRECAYDSKDAGTGSCTTSADCERPRHCFEGVCRNDDCPAGFECQHVQPRGPLADKLFCVYKQPCSSNPDCEALGDMDCVRMGCFDSTLLTPTPDPTAPHTLTCEKRDAMSCDCPDGTMNCTGADLTCFYTGDGGGQWPAGSVEVRDVCQRHGS